MPVHLVRPRLVPAFLLGIAVCTAFVVSTPAARAEETKQAQPADTPFDPSSLPKDRDERKKALKDSIDKIIVRSNKLIEKFRNVSALKEEEYAELDHLFQALRESEAVYNNGKYAIDAASHNSVHVIFPADASFEYFVKRLKKWREVRPNSPTAPALMALLYMNWAWNARGSGFAAGISEKQFELFHDRMREARFYCEEAEKLADNDPTIWYYRVKIAQAINEPKEAVYEILRQSHKAGSYYLRTHEGAAEYLLPRWHGEPGDCEELAAWSKEELGGDLGAEAYGRIALMVNNYDPETIYLGHYSEADLLAAGRVILEKYPQSHRWRNFALLTAYVAQDRELAKKIHEGLGGKLDMNVWHYQSLENNVANWLERSIDRPVDAPVQKWLSVVYAQEVSLSNATPLLFYRRGSFTDVLFAYHSQKTEAFPLLGSPFGDDTLFLVSNDARRVVILGMNRRTPEVEEEGAAFVKQLDSADDPVELADVPSKLNSPVLSPDGQWLAVNLPGQGIQVWDTTTGKVKHGPDDFETMKFAKADLFVGKKANRILARTLIEPGQPPVYGFHLLDPETAQTIAESTTDDLEKKLNLRFSKLRAFDGDAVAYFTGSRGEKDQPARQCLAEVNLVTGATHDILVTDRSIFTAFLSSDYSLAGLYIKKTEREMNLDVVEVATAKPVAQLTLPRYDWRGLGFTEGSRAIFALCDGRLYQWELDKLREQFHRGEGTSAGGK
jgi:hypothetical protein